MKPPPMDPWKPGVRANDVPISNGGEPGPFAEHDDDAEATANGHDPSDTPLRPNRIDINRHLGTLFPPEFVQDHPDAWIEIAFADLGGDGKPNAARHFSAFDLAGAAEFAVKKNAAGFNIYVGVALRQGKTGPNSNGRSSGANFLASLYQWVDFEKPGDDLRINAILDEKKLLTTMTVVTGNTPNFRAHLYFKLAGNTTKDQVRDVNIALKTLLSTDDVEDVCRVMRLAGTVSYPPPDKVARGYIPELVTLHPRKNAPSYTVKQLTGLAGTGKTSDPFEEFASENKRGRSDDELEALLEASKTEGKWHNNIRDAIATMIGRGYADSAIRFACKPYCRDGYGDRDLDDLIDRARKKWNKPDMDQAAPGAGTAKKKSPLSNDIITEQSWIRDERGVAYHWAGQLASRLGEDQSATARKSLGRASFANGVEKFAQHHPMLVMTADCWNGDLMLLGTPGGTVDLRTGKLRASRREDHITKMTSVAPLGEPCPRWFQFLNEATGNDTGLIRFLQQWCGYGLTGLTREQALVFIYGPGGNGKGVFLNLIQAIMKDYAVTSANVTLWKGEREQRRIV